MILNIDIEREFKDIKLKEALAQQVICQIKFLPILKVSENNFISLFQDKIRDEYPEYDLVTQLNHGAMLIQPERKISIPLWYTSTPQVVGYPDKLIHRGNNLRGMAL